MSEPVQIQAEGSPEDVKALARRLVNTLLERGMTPQDIAEAMNHRVSGRTIYRWAKGESGPQQTSGVVLLQKIVDKTPVPVVETDGE